MPHDEKHPASAESEAAAPAKASKFPYTPLAGILIVLFIYFASKYLAEIPLVVFPMIVLGWDTKQVMSFLQDSAYIQFAYVLLVEAVTLMMLFWFMRLRKVAAAAIGLIKPKLRDLGYALLAYPPYFLMNAAAAYSATLIFKLDASQRQQTGFETAASAPELIVTFISLVILPPIVEEIVMRGFLFSSLKSKMTVVKAALVTSVLFAVAHLQLGGGAPALWIAAIDTFILSLVLCYLRQKTGSLWAGIFLHMLKNALAFTVLFILPESIFR